MKPAAYDSSQVAPRLWIGAAVDAVDRTVAERQAEHIATELGVGLVIDCRRGADDSEVWRTRRGVQYVNLGVEDSGSPLPPAFFTHGVEHVLNHWTATATSVLIHCESGSHRSPALALAVLLVDGTNVDDAARQLAAARPVVGDRYFKDARRWFEGFSVAAPEGPS